MRDTGRTHHTVHTVHTRATGTFGSRTRSRLTRLSCVVALSASALLSAAGPSSAHTLPAADPLPAGIPDYAAALDTLKSVDVRDTVCRFLSTPVPTGTGAGTQTIPETPEPCQGLPTFTIKDPVALNEITPGFVAGTARPLPTEALKLTHLVTSLNATVNGRNATVMLAPTQGGGWHLAAVRDGDGDAAYAAKAGVGTLVFTEPQIRGWYQLRLDTVEPLNNQAREGLGGRASMSLADYQQQVKARYADKLPGSDYVTQGLYSGYAPRHQAAEESSPAPLLAGSGAVLALAGGAFALHRRRRGRTD